MPIVSKNTSKIKPRTNASSMRGIVRSVLGKINKPNRYKNPNACPKRARFFRNRI
jgi:hypothetical protein